MQSYMPKLMCQRKYFPEQTHAGICKNNKFVILFIANPRAEASPGGYLNNLYPRRSHS